eukprot:4861523-Amphidinium_carterae.1
MPSTRVLEWRLQCMVRDRPWPVTAPSAMWSVMATTRKCVVASLSPMIRGTCCGQAYSPTENDYVPQCHLQKEIREGNLTRSPLTSGFNLLTESASQKNNAYGTTFISTHITHRHTLEP